MTDRLPKAIDSVFLSPATDRVRNSPQGYDWKQTPRTNKPQSKKRGKKKARKDTHEHATARTPLLISLFFHVATCFGKASKMEKCLCLFYSFLGLSLLER